MTETMVCPDCACTKVIKDSDRAEYYCSDCGVVIEDGCIDFEHPEYRIYDSEDAKQKSHIGSKSNIMLHDKGLSTEISYGNRDGAGGIIRGDKGRIHRLRKWQRRIRISNATERNLTYAFTEIDKISSKLGLPRLIRESACMIYRKAVKKNLIRGRSIIAVVAGSIYAACRSNSVPRTLDEIARHTRISKKDIGRVYRFMASSLNLFYQPSTAENYVDRFCSELHLANITCDTAKKILKKCEEARLIKGGPLGMTAASIYMSCQINHEKRTQKDISQVASVTEVTIRNRYRDIESLGISKKMSVDELSVAKIS